MVPSIGVRLFGFAVVLLVYLVSVGAVWIVVIAGLQRLFGLHVPTAVGGIVGVLYAVGVGIKLYRIVVKGELPGRRWRPSGGKLPKA